MLQPVDLSHSIPQLIVQRTNLTLQSIELMLNVLVPLLRIIQPFLELISLIIQSQQLKFLVLDLIEILVLIKSQTTKLILHALKLFSQQLNLIILATQHFVLLPSQNKEKLTTILISE
jgi:hypothetical protein